jgi:dTDP-4-amino-4,6-dideoxygalactose transaminase
LIPFLDLKAQYHGIKGEIDQAIARVLESSQFILGSEVKMFEEEFACFTGCRFGIGVNSGTSALHLALLALGIGPGDEVITVPFTFVATVAAICYTGATPVFVDIDPRSYTMDVDRIERAITKRTKAIVPVHLYGQPADMDAILEIAQRRGIRVVEDAAQAHGAAYKHRPVGSMGDVGCFSFYPGKNLGAYGEGGAAVTSDAALDRTIRMLRDWGQERRYHHVLRGYNYRMDGMQGAILRVKLRHLPAWTEARRAHAAEYTRLLANSGVSTPAAIPYGNPVHHVYPILSSDRDELQQELQTAGVQTGIHYPVPVHLLEAYRDLGYREGDFPVAERVAAAELSLPLYPELTLRQIETVVDGVLAFSACQQSVA